MQKGPRYPSWQCSEQISIDQPKQSITHQTRDVSLRVVYSKWPCLPCLLKEPYTETESSRCQSAGIYAVCAPWRRHLGVPSFGEATLDSFAKRLGGFDPGAVYRGRSKQLGRSPSSSSCPNRLPMMRETPESRQPRKNALINHDHDCSDGRESK